MKLVCSRTVSRYSRVRLRRNRHVPRCNITLVYILGLIYNIFYCIHKTMIEKICSPALLYLGFSMIQITIDLFQGDYSTSLLKFIVMIIFTTILNLLCLNGFTKLVWFIVLIPILLLTYISSVLFYVFGINPGKTNINIQKQSGSGSGQAPPASGPAPPASGPAPPAGPKM